MTRIYNLKDHTSIKFTQQPAQYGSFLFWDIVQGFLAVFCFMALLLAVYMIATH